MYKLRFHSLLAISLLSALSIGTFAAEQPEDKYDTQLLTSNLFYKHTDISYQICQFFNFSQQKTLRETSQPLKKIIDDSWLSQGRIMHIHSYSEDDLSNKIDLLKELPFIFFVSFNYSNNNDMAATKALLLFKRLEIIDLHNKYHLTNSDEGVTSYFFSKDFSTELSKLTSLTQISACFCNVKDENFESLSQLTNLRKIILDHNNFTTEGIKNLDKFTKLSHLSLVHTHLSINSLELVTKLPDLTHLYIDDNNITDMAIRNIATNLIKLKFISLSGNKIKDEGLKEISNTLTNLEYLGLHDCEFTDTGVKAIANTLTNLTYLDLSNNNVSDDSINNLIHNITSLRTLKINRTNVTDEMIQSLESKQKEGRFDNLRLY